MSEGEGIRVFAADADLDGTRLDAALVLLLESFTRSGVQKLIEGTDAGADGGVTLNGRPANKSTRIQAGDVITVCLPAPVEDTLEPEDIPLTIVYEDESLLVVHKPKGMVVHPAPGHGTGTLAAALLYHCRGQLSGINGVLRPGIVHRIDKDTSGLLLVAKSDAAHQSLARQIAEHSLLREYQAVVYGRMRAEEGTVDAPIGRHPVERKRMAVTERGGRQAVTHYQVLARYPGFTHVRLRLQTGRTHQIRVHMAYLGHPVAGDPVYGPKKVLSRLEGQCLHAKTLGFIHPQTGQEMAFDTPLPDYFTAFLRSLGPREEAEERRE